MTADVGPAFHVELPGNWVRLDLHAAADRTLLDDAVDTRMGDLPELQDFRAVFVDYAATVAQAALDRDVAFAAVLIDAADDETLPVLATMAISYAVLTQELAQTNGEPVVERAPDREALVDTMTSVEVPLGLALRRERIDDHLGEDGERQVVSFTVQYVLQPDTSDYGVIVTFSSPMLPMREGLNAMFDRIVRSMRPGAGASA